MNNSEMLIMSSADMLTMTIISTLCLTGAAIVFFALRHKTKMKELEIESLRIQKANLQAEVNQAVQEKMDEYKDRVQVLEEIITSKNYDVSEKISRIK